jgi:hypothetical protein
MPGGPLLQRRPQLGHRLGEVRRQLVEARRHLALRHPQGPAAGQKGAGEVTRLLAAAGAAAAPPFARAAERVVGRGAAAGVAVVHRLLRAGVVAGERVGLLLFSAAVQVGADRGPGVLALHVVVGLVLVTQARGVARGRAARRQAAVAVLGGPLVQAHLGEHLRGALGRVAGHGHRPLRVQALLGRPPQHALVDLRRVQAVGGHVVGDLGGLLRRLLRHHAALRQPVGDGAVGRARGLAQHARAEVGRRRRHVRRRRAQKRRQRRRQCLRGRASAAPRAARTRPPGAAGRPGVRGRPAGPPAGPAARPRRAPGGPGGRGAAGPPPGPPPTSGVSSTSPRRRGRPAGLNSSIWRRRAWSPWPCRAPGGPASRRPCSPASLPAAWRPSAPSRSPRASRRAASGAAAGWASGSAAATAAARPPWGPSESARAAPSAGPLVGPRAAPVAGRVAGPEGRAARSAGRRAA